MKRIWTACLAMTVGLVSACDEKGMAYGDANSIIAVMSPELWEEVEGDFYDALERTILTVRDEKTFTVTYQDPEGEYWGDLRRFRQIIVVGTPAETWMADVLAEAEAPPSGPGVVQVHDVWSRGQTITAIVLDDAADAETVRTHLGEIHDLLDRQYRGYARNRMFMSGIDSALADTLSAEAGFEVLLPVVYRWRSVDSVYVFRNDNPDPSELIREVVVTWRRPDRARLGADALLAWREELVGTHYNEPQLAVLDHATESRIMHQGRDGYELQGMWTNPPERGWPAGGPFITRMIDCAEQDRMYLVDAWLYAPGKEKYEYMLQLETILDSFRCG